jgi:hypothetical protein
VAPWLQACQFVFPIAVRVVVKDSAFVEMRFNFVIVFAVESARRELGWVFILLKQGTRPENGW